MEKAKSLTRISDIRRKELRRAAHEVLQMEGYAGTTLEKVAAHAGASKGIVLHYFRNKQELFEQAMREGNLILRDRVVRRLKLARTPQERLLAVIEGNFERQYFKPADGHGWIALCAEVPREPQLARIQKVIHARMRSNLLSALRPILAADQCESVALAISSLIDGLWVRLGLNAEDISRDIARQQMYDYLRWRLPDFDWVMEPD
jgi:TetR/AcrR family transcriptional repressor of bet genes